MILTQCSNVRMCQDPEELAIVEANGGAVVAPMLAATNRIATALAEQFPGVMFDTFAYTNTLQPPSMLRPAGQGGQGHGYLYRSVVPGDSESA